jgi:SAM-dependent methyltransferase
MSPDLAQEIQRIRAVHELREATPSIRYRDSPGRRGNQAIVQEARCRLAGLVARHAAKPLTACRVLDIGCGYGDLLGWFHQVQGVPAAQLVGIDLLPSRIAAARARFPGIRFEETSEERLDFHDASVDLVSVFTVFSSILAPEMAANLAGEIRRILISGGGVLWYDVRYPNPWNPNLRAVTRTELGRLFPGFALHLQSVTLLPPLARKLGWLTSSAYPLLAAIPVLRTHLIGLLIRP